MIIRNSKGIPIINSFDDAHELLNDCENRLNQLLVEVKYLKIRKHKSFLKWMFDGIFKFNWDVTY